MHPQTPETKPVLDAVTDAVTAVGHLVQSLRQTAKDARTRTKSAAHDAKSELAGSAARLKNGVKHAEGTLKDRVHLAWSVLAHGEGVPSGRPAPARRARARRKSASKA